MQILGDAGLLNLDRCDSPSGSPVDSDLLLAVSVSVRGFAAEDQAWVLGAKWNGFVHSLRCLERGAGDALVSRECRPMSLCSKCSRQIALATRH